MGIEAIGKLISYANKTQACKNLSFVKNATAAKVLERELKFAPELIGDTCHFSKVDRSLDPEFLKDLLKIEGSSFERITQIKDKILQAMGYDSKLVKVVKRPELAEIGYTAGINYASGEFLITDLFEANQNGLLIPTIRHECEHLSQAAKVCKAKGFKVYEEAVKKRFQIAEEPIPKINKSFWDSFSKTADITDSNIEKYYRAITDVVSPSNDLFRNSCVYYNNALEVSAYSIEERAGNILNGGMYVTAKRRWPQNAETIGKLMEEKGVLPEEKQNVLNAIIVCIMENKGMDIRVMPDLKTLAKIHADVEKELRIVSNEDFKVFLEQIRLWNKRTV